MSTDISIMGDLADAFDVEVWEAAKSRTSRIGRDQSTRGRAFYARGAINEIAAELAVSSYIPAVYGNLPFDVMETEEILFGWLYRCEVQWSTPKRQDPDFATVEFDTTGGTTKVTHSIRTVNSYAPNGQTAPNFNNAINVHDEAGVKPDGVDIPSPKLKFTVAGVLGFDVVDDEYIKALAAATGKTNDAPVGPYDTGELLFLGASGQTRKVSEDQPGVDMKWQFEASENATDLTVAGVDGIEKGGHEYVWVRTEPATDSNGTNTMTNQVVGVYVEQVYYDTDYTQLQIPDTSQQEMPNGFPTNTGV